ncbi:YARHG domain-containing protein [Winogradskyella wichelsiae]|uniref:YARHG domain-containing protein n=1 Tax=Winogradskyella wichelsiae TaxID=2697007 RepID=UPI0015CD1E99|nr:YARHG domain-containing protein [Winogradskyella wichelsiae]
MKNNFIKLFVLLLFTVNLTAQDSNVWEGDLYPKDFDSFQSGSYSTLRGDLRVYNTDLRDLKQLQSLKIINGNVHIGIDNYKQNLKGGNKALISLNGLDNLTEISGELEIRDNKLLESITALKNLKKVSELNISLNPMLVSLDGLNKLSSTIPLGLTIYKNKRLQDISQLSGITLIGKHLAISSNLSLKTLEGLHNIEAIENGYLDVRSNTYLENLKGLRQLKTVDKNVVITTNPAIKNLKGLEKLSSIGEILRISENGKLLNLEGLKSLKSIGKDFEIKANSELTSLDGLKKLTTIIGDIDIEDNSILQNINELNLIKGEITNIYISKNRSLKEISGLNNITTVKENFVFSNNHLEKVTGFNNLKTIGESLSITCHYLKSISGFSNLTTTQDFGIGSEIETLDLTNSFKKLTVIKKGFYLFSNKKLEHFKGPNALTNIEKMTINTNEKLISLSGFNGLKTITEKIEFKDNTLLKSIDGFNSLEAVGDINIEDNPVLEHIKGFEKINFIDNLFIDENIKLSDLSGFSNLKSANEIYLRRNFALEDLTGFSSLQKVNEEINLHYNSELKSLNGLENLIFIGKQLDFTGNRKLTDYNALQETFLQSISNNNLFFSANGYNPNRNQLLIHTKLDTKLIPESYLEPQSRWELSLLRNEIFARKGYVFGKGELTDYFTKQGWYKPIEGIEIVLNDIEEENVRLIKTHEKIRTDMATKALQNLKQQYLNTIDFSGDYKQYYPVLINFIKAIDVNNVKKSNRLSFSKEADFDKNVIGIERQNDDELDHISIYFDYIKRTLKIIIEDNYLEQDDYDSWLTNKIIDFKFKINEDLTVEFENATDEYN